MHGKDLGPLHIGNSCAAGPSYGTPNVGAGVVSDSVAYLAPTGLTCLDTVEEDAPRLTAT